MSLSFRKHLVYSLLLLICFNLNNADNKEQDLQVLIGDPSSLRVTWQHDPCTSGYTVDYKLINTDQSEEIKVPLRVRYTSENAESQLLMYLVTNSTYNVYMKPPYDEVNGFSMQGPELSVLRILLATVTAPTASPSKVALTNATQRSLTFSWRAPPCESRFGPITGYTCKLSRVGPVKDVKVRNTLNKTITIQGLKPYTNYSFQVAANNSAGMGPFSDAVGGRTQELQLWIIGLVVGSFVFLVLVSIVIIRAVYFTCGQVRNDPLDASSRPTEVVILSAMELQLLTAVRLAEDKHTYENIGLPKWAIGWEIKWKHLVVEDTILGKGNFGEVHLGRVKTNEKVTKAAVKTLKGGASQDADNFLKEFQTMIEIGLHPNIVGLLGACFNEGTLYVALEFLPGDNLRKYLRKNRQIQLQGQHSQCSASPVTLSQLLKFSVDVSKGMHHLAEAGIIHRDLAARNILLGEELIAKVSDFGLARGDSIYVQESQTRVPLRWLAFESLTHHLYVSKSDVWSFGVLLWEIVTFGGTPYPGIHSWELPGKIVDGYRMPRPENCPDDIYNLMLNCWKKAPNKRPSFKEITDALEKIRQVLAIKTNTSLAIYENLSVQEFDDH